MTNATASAEITEQEKSVLASLAREDDVHQALTSSKLDPQEWGVALQSLKSKGLVGGSLATQMVWLTEAGEEASGGPANGPEIQAWRERASQKVPARLEELRRGYVQEANPYQRLTKLATYVGELERVYGWEQRLRMAELRKAADVPLLKMRNPCYCDNKDCPSHPDSTGDQFMSCPQKATDTVYGKYEAVSMCSDCAKRAIESGDFTTSKDDWEAPKREKMKAPLSDSQLNDLIPHIDQRYETQGGGVSSILDSMSEMLSELSEADYKVVARQLRPVIKLVIDHRKSGADERYPTWPPTTGKAIGTPLRKDAPADPAGDNEKKYYVFVRSWTAERGPGPEKVLERNLTYAEARRTAQAYNAENKPGKNQRKAEFSTMKAAGDELRKDAPTDMEEGTLLDAAQEAVRGVISESEGDPKWRLVESKAKAFLKNPSADSAREYLTAVRFSGAGPSKTAVRAWLQHVRGQSNS